MGPASLARWLIVFVIAAMAASTLRLAAAAPMPAQPSSLGGGMGGAGGITELSFAAQPDSSLYISGKYQGKPVNLVRKGAAGSGTWTLYAGALTDRVRFTFDDKKGLQEILAVDKGQRITLNMVGQERIEYRLYAPDRRFLIGSVRYRKDGRWLQGIMRTEVFSSYGALMDVAEVTLTMGPSNARPANQAERALAWMKAHWHGASLMSSAHADTGDELVRGFFSPSAQDARGFWGAPLHEMWKGALVGAAAFTVKLASQTMVAGETAATGAALTAAAPFLVAVGTGVAVGVVMEKAYNWVEAKNLGGSTTFREAYDRLVADTYFSKQLPPRVPEQAMSELDRPQAPTALQQSAAPVRSPMSLLDMADKLDKLDKLDFGGALEKADLCTSRRNFDCSNAQLEKAAKFANNPNDRLALNASRQKISEEKAVMAEEARRAEEERRREQERVREQERLAQAEAQRDSGFQLGKALALATGAALGGVHKLAPEAQARILSGIVRDSQAGQTGISNTQAGINSLKGGGPVGSVSGGQGFSGAQGSAGSATGSVSKEAFNAGELACQKEADRSARPYGDSQLDTFCVLATSNACVRRKFNFQGYEAERLESCARLQRSARALSVDPNRCGACS